MWKRDEEWAQSLALSLVLNRTLELELGASSPPRVACAADALRDPFPPPRLVHPQPRCSGLLSDWQAQGEGTGCLRGSRIPPGRPHAGAPGSVSSTDSGEGHREAEPYEARKRASRAALISCLSSESQHAGYLEHLRVSVLTAFLLDLASAGSQLPPPPLCQCQGII